MAINEILENLKQAILNGDAEAAKKTAMTLVEHDVKPVDVVNQALRPALDEVGTKYERQELFLTELILAGDAAQEALKILSPKGTPASFGKGKVDIGTMCGDIHDIGRSIVTAMLCASGYEIVDLGNDVQPNKFVDSAKSGEASIIAMSCLLSTSMYYMRDVIQRLSDEGLREKFSAIVGGAAITPEWTKEIGADGWAKEAERAVRLCDMLIQEGNKLPKPVILGEWH
jgi:5-methyltetrahydrofolate--homocysteine methyltransferase